MFRCLSLWGPLTFKPHDDAETLRKVLPSPGNSSTVSCCHIRVRVNDWDLCLVVEDTGWAPKAQHRSAWGSRAQRCRWGVQDKALLAVWPVGVTLASCSLPLSCEPQMHSAPLWTSRKVLWWGHCLSSTCEQIHMGCTVGKEASLGHGDNVVYPC